jgi:hypothetical protein
MTPFRFLHLPAEIRNSIYRLLLCHPTTIEAIYRTMDLHPAVLCANHQVYDEAKAILYGENYFGMCIRDKLDGKRAYFIRCAHFARNVERELSQFRLIQRYDIHIDIFGDEEEILVVKRIVRDVCKVLSEVPRIKHLIITLGGYQDSYQALLTAFERFESQVDQNVTPKVSRSSASLADSNNINVLSSEYSNGIFKVSLGNSNGIIELSLETWDRFFKLSFEDPNDIIIILWTEKLEKFPIKEWLIENYEILSQRATALQPFTRLRNVGRVDVRGVVKPQNKQYLIDVMQGGSGLNNLPKMYGALEYYGGPFYYCGEDLEDACEAMEDGDVELFKRLREKIIQTVTACMMTGKATACTEPEIVTARMAGAKERLFDYDARTDT